MSNANRRHGNKISVRHARYMFLDRVNRVITLIDGRISRDEHR